MQGLGSKYLTYTNAQVRQQLGCNHTNTDYVKLHEREDHRNLQTTPVDALSTCHQFNFTNMQRWNSVIKGMINEKASILDKPMAIGLMQFLPYCVSRLF